MSTKELPIRKGCTKTWISKGMTERKSCTLETIDLSGSYLKLEGIFGESSNFEAAVIDLPPLRDLSDGSWAMLRL